jgi:hypothetical protein
LLAYCAVVQRRFAVQNKKADRSAHAEVISFSAVPASPRENFLPFGNYSMGATPRQSIRLGKSGRAGLENSAALRYNGGGNECLPWHTPKPLKS